MKDVYWASLLASLLKSLESVDPEFRTRFEENVQNLTLDELTHALHLLRGHYSNPPEAIQRQCLRSAKTFLGLD